MCASGSWISDACTARNGMEYVHAIPWGSLWCQVHYHLRYLDFFWYWAVSYDDYEICWAYICLGIDYNIAVVITLLILVLHPTSTRTKPHRRKTPKPNPYLGQQTRKQIRLNMDGGLMFHFFCHLLRTSDLLLANTSTFDYCSENLRDICQRGSWRSWGTDFYLCAVRRILCFYDVLRDVFKWWYLVFMFY